MSKRPGAPSKGPHKRVNTSVKLSRTEIATYDAQAARDGFTSRSAWLRWLADERIAEKSQKA